MSHFYPQGDSDKYSLSIILDENRDYAGQAILLYESKWKILEPIPVLGRADDMLANEYGNPSRDPLKIGGDTPTGIYKTWARSSECENTNSEVYSNVVSDGGLKTYGSHGILVMEAIEGQGLEAQENRRHTLLAHAGTNGKDYGLRPTAGCLRFYPEDFKKLVAYIAQHSAYIETEIVIGNVSLYHPVNFATDGRDTSVDPPPLPVNSDASSDRWSDEMYEAIIGVDMEIDLGHFYDKLREQGYDDPLTALDDLHGIGEDFTPDHD